MIRKTLKLTSITKLFALTEFLGALFHYYKIMTAESACPPQADRNSARTHNFVIIGKLIFLILGLIWIFFLGVGKINAQDPPVYDWYVSNFDSTVNIVSDQNIEVTEKITADFLVPKHGIYRTIPYRYEDNRGQGRSIFLDFISITDENGQPDKFSQSYSGGVLTCKIGDENLTLTGEKTYIIKYRLSNLLNYYDNLTSPEKAGQAELYFNVNGNDWSVPIKKISLSIILPDSQAPKENKYYLGFFGEQNSSRVKVESGTPYKISAENVEPGEELTIVSRWEAMLTPRPDSSQRFLWFLAANGIYLMPIFLLLLLLILLLKYGHDPLGRGTIAPAFEPPKNLSLLEIGTIADERVDNRDLSATIISFATNGYLKIEEIGSKRILRRKDYEIIKIKEFSGNPDDEYIFSTLFADKKALKLSEAGKEGKLSKVKNQIEDRVYKTMVKRKFFSRNPKIIKGVYIGIGIFCIFSVFIFPALLDRFFTITASALSFLAAAGLFFIFARYMPQRTKEGVLLKEQVEGFKLYLKTAERYRLKFAEKSGIFEKYLPYAIALGVADIWAKKFEGIYKEPPEWYKGDFRTFSMVYFSQSLTSDFSTSVNSAFATSAASSGGSGFSSGGGFSGGGFGGGGGGSW